MLCLCSLAYLCSGATAQFWIDPAESLGLLPSRPRYQRDSTQVKVLLYIQGHRTNCALKQ